MKYESSTSNGSEVVAKVEVFRNVGQRSRSRSQTTVSFEKVSSAEYLKVQKFWPRLKCFRHRVKDRQTG